jgi:hypothetical protein
MFERRNTPLLPWGTFLIRQLKWMLAAGLIACASLVAGAFGYRFIEGLSWLDAFHNAALMLTGIGEETVPTTRAGKVFSIFYALFGTVVFASVIGMVLAPGFHRILHHFHLGTEERDPD